MSTLTAAAAPRSRLHPGDLLRVGSVGLVTRRVRAALSALGVAIGIAAMVAVLAISESSKADLLAQLDRLGTNLLTVKPGQTIGGDNASLPGGATGMVGRIGPVGRASATGAVDATVRRNDHVPETETGGITVKAATADLLHTLGGRMASGGFLDAATERYPVVVLVAVAAERLGITDVSNRPQVHLAGQWFTVLGILEPLPLAPELDRSALIGSPIAVDRLNADGTPSTIYVRSDPDAVEDVRSVLAATANPEAPEEVAVSRPSDALEARAAAKTAFTSLFLGLGAVALLVGGVGIANVMVISVLERRREIGLRRALGATKRHVALQFLTESLLLSGIGGVVGVSLGSLVSLAYAKTQGWDTVLPLVGLAGGVAAALLIGAAAGLYPAARAARLAPTEALRTT